jgi:hypothetical protein
VASADRARGIRPCLASRERRQSMLGEG